MKLEIDFETDRPKGAKYAEVMIHWLDESYDPIRATSLHTETLEPIFKIGSVYNHKFLGFVIFEGTTTYDAFNQTVAAVRLTLFHTKETIRISRNNFTGYLQCNDPIDAYCNN